MKMFRNKGEFFDRLWENYQEFKRRENEARDDDKPKQRGYLKESMEQCFIYKFQKDKKLLAAQRLAEDPKAFEDYRQRVRRDKYVLLCAAYSLWEKGTLSTDEFGEIFNTTAERENGGSRYIGLFKTDPVLAYEEFSHHLLCGSIQDMFSKRGYKQPKYDADGGLIYSEPSSDGKDGYSDEIEMLYSYYEYIGRGDMNVSGCASRNSGLSDQARQGAKLYGYLKTVKAGEVFIPLHIDPYSGAGVYIIGDHHTDAPDSEDCHVYMIHFEQEEDYDDIVSGDSIFYMTYIGKRFETAEDAFGEFERLSDGVSEDLYYGYTNYNSGLSVVSVRESVGEEFFRYIESGASLDLRQRQDTLRKKLGLEQERLEKTKYKR